ncbi:hypothetical protein VKT23_000496 [Stygiomarasmius scandens]|uniref:BTB domain-containing protein n=1 Tax=Marasmiellus scandens TaxID=2682957 RepID=A0ABR1K492_9AGAR
MLSLPQGDQHEGSRDSSPIELDGSTTLVDFERFVDLLYPSTSPWKNANRSQEEWNSILKLATLWGFPNIRCLAIEHLSKMKLDAFTNIELGRKYSVSQWLRNGYMELVKRFDTLTREEVKVIGCSSSIGVFRVREEMAKRFQSAYSVFSTTHWSESAIKEGVEKEFVDELSQVDHSDQEYRR